VINEAERIWCGGKAQHIPPQELEELKEQYSGVVAQAVQREGGALSYFEALTALAFKLFQQKPVDVAVVEAGLGGETDATNVFPASGQLLSIITTVGLDHMDALGDTVFDIATVKAGITRPGRPVVLGPQLHSEAVEAVRLAARSKGCPLVDSAREVSVTPAGLSRSADGSLVQRCHIRAGGLEVEGAGLGLLGLHQLDNVASVVGACRQLASAGWDIPEGALRDGLAATRLPGRFEVRSATISGQRMWLVLDAAHTTESAQATANVLREAFPGHNLALIVSLLEDKDVR